MPMKKNTTQATNNALSIGLGAGDQATTKNPNRTRKTVKTVKLAPYYTTWEMNEEGINNFPCKSIEESISLTEC